MPTEIAVLQRDVPTLAERAMGIQITSPVSYTAATVIVKDIKGLRKQIAETFKPIKQRQDEAKRETLAQERRLDEPLKAGEDYIKKALSDYDAEMERVRQEAERKLREVARKVEEERILAQAAELEKVGEKELADMVLEQPIQTPAVFVPKAVPPTKGVSFTERWYFRVTDIALVPREYLMLDEVKTGSVVRAMKANTNIPGIEVYSERTTNIRT